jgi:hypothetical protein
VNLAELRDELERLGSRPVPVLDDDRVEALERRLLDAFGATAPEPDADASLAAARRRRRQLLAAGAGAAAAAMATAMVVARDGSTTYEVSAAMDAVAMYPDGGRRVVQAGDRVPAGGLIRTGPSGEVTIEETTVGADRVILLDEETIALLPARPAPPSAEPDLEVPNEGTATEPVATAPATAPRAAPVTLVPTIASSASPVPAAVNPAPLSLSLAETSDGIEVSWTPSDAPGIVGYVVVRGTADSGRLVDVAQLSPDRTAFTDTTPPAGVELCYRVVAVDADGMPVAESETLTALFEGSGSSNEVPPSTDTPGTLPATQPPTTQPPGATTTAPPPTAAAPTTAAPSTSVVESPDDTAVVGSAPDAPSTTGRGGRHAADHQAEDGNLDDGG